MVGCCSWTNRGFTRFSVSDCWFVVLPVVDFVFPWFHLLLIRSNKLLQYPFTLNCALFIIPSICSVKATKSFNPTQFEFWLGSILTVNQCGPHSLFSRRKELKPLSCFHSDGTGRVLNSLSFSPEWVLCRAAHYLEYMVAFFSCCSLGCTLLYRINRQTLAISDEAVYHSSVYVRNCQRSTVYILAPVRYDPQNRKVRVPVFFDLLLLLLFPLHILLLGWSRWRNAVIVSWCLEQWLLWLSLTTVTALPSLQHAGPSMSGN